MIKNWTVSLLLFIIFLAAGWAVLMPGFFRVHDFTHAARIAEMTTALREGQFPVRWVKNLGFGYGMPLYEFYAPLPYYLGAVFYWLGLDVILTIKLLYLGCTLLTLVGAYKLGAILYGRSGGLVMAAALTLAPYRAINLYIRGALSEAWGIMALPWILYGLILVIKKKKSGWLILVASLVTLMLSHNLTTLMFVPVSGIFAIVYWLYAHQLNLKKSFREVKSLLIIAGCYLLAIGLSAFYMLPALAENKFTQINSILSGYFDYSLHFLYIRQFLKPGWGYGGSGWGPDDGISFFLGVGQLLGVGLLGLLILKRFWRIINRNKSYELGSKKNLSLNSYFFSSLFFTLSLIALLLFSLFMSLGHSQPLWQALPFLSFIQFPWRWLSVTVVLLALLDGLVVSWLSNRALRLVTMTVLLAVLLGNTLYFRPESFADHPQDIYYTDPAKIQVQMSSILPDYIPAQMSPNIKPAEANVVISGGSGQGLEVLVDRGHEKLVKLDQGPERTITFSVADFPGWQSYLDTVKVDHDQGSLGQIEVVVPSGAHQVGLKWESTPIRHYSDWLSVISLLVLLFLTLPNYLSKANQILHHD